MIVGGFFWVILGVLGAICSSAPLGRVITKRFQFRKEAGFAIDAIKCALFMLLLTPAGMEILYKGIEFPLWSWEHLKTLQYGLGFFLLYGHCYSHWEQLDQGRGIFPLLGVVLVAFPVAFAVGLLGMLIALFLKGGETNSNLAALFSLTVAHLVLTPSGAYLWLLGLMIFMVLVRHERDLDQLLQSS